MILYDYPIASANVRLAYNNDIIKFKSSHALDPLYAEIIATIEGEEQFKVRLYPDPNGKFFFNFKPYVTALINTRNFEDTLETDLQVPNPVTFQYDYTEGTLLSLRIEIAVTLSNGNVDNSVQSLQWLAGVEQIGNKIIFNKTETFLLTPFVKNTTNKHYLKYWQGYPFDVTIMSSLDKLRFTNNTTGMVQDFVLGPRIRRLFFSDGRTDESIEDILPMDEGFNDITIKSIIGAGSPIFPVDDVYLVLEKVAYKCGVYLKWLNKYGGYSYWLFENTYAIDRSTKQLGELDRDYANLDRTNARAIQIGKESQDSIKVIAELLTEDEREIVAGILDSPKIYMFTGVPFSQNSHKDWIDVSLKTSNVRLRNPKQELTNFVFDLELPTRYTQTL